MTPCFFITRADSDTTFSLLDDIVRWTRVQSDRHQILQGVTPNESPCLAKFSRPVCGHPWQALAFYVIRNITGVGLWEGEEISRFRGSSLKACGRRGSTSTAVIWQAEQTSRGVGMGGDGGRGRCAGGFSAPLFFFRVADPRGPPNRAMR